MSFFGKLTGLMLAGVCLCQFSLVVPQGLADQPPPLRAITAGTSTSDLMPLEEKLGELKTHLLSLQQQPLRKIVKDPVSSRNRVEVHLLTEGIGMPPEKIELKWDNQPVMAMEYTDHRRVALSKGGADKLVSLETSPGTHTLWVRYFKNISPNDHTSYEATLPVQKKTGMLVLLLKPKGLNQGFVLETEVLEGPITDQKEQWLQLWFQNAIFHYHLGQFPQAASLLLTCLELQEVPSKQPELLLWLGRTYLDWGLELQAILTFQRLIQQSPSMDRILPEAWYYMQKAQYHQGQSEAVISAYARIGQRFPPGIQPEMHYIAAQSFLRLKDYPKAIASLNQIPRTSRHYPFALYALGLAYLGFGDTYAAQQAFKKLIDLDPKNDPHVNGLIEKSHVTIGLLFIEQNRYPEALSDLGLLSTRSRFFDQALFGIGWSYMKMEEYVKAIVAFGDLIEMLPESPYAYEARLLRGFCYSKLKAYTKAVSNYREALEISSRQVTLLTQRMETLRQEGVNLNEATRSLRVDLSGGSDKIRETLKGYQELADLIPMDAAQTKGNDLKLRLKELEHHFSTTFQELALQDLQRKRERLEDLSIQAGIGIAKNLTLERTEFGGEELVLE